MENILFKISYPAEFHAQTALEAAIKLHPHIIDRIENIEKIKIKTQESAMRIINKTGPLHNPADRDHCLQYITAIGLLFGELNAQHYENSVASDPRIDQLRAKMEVTEEPRFTREYLDPDKRSIGNAVQVCFNDGTCTEEISIDYPVGHRVRRQEGIPLLLEKFNRSVNAHYSKPQAERILAACENLEALDKMRVSDFIGLFVQ